MIGFCIWSPDSFESVQSKWVPEVHHFCPDAPIMLVGLKSDLRGQEVRQCGPTLAEEVTLDNAIQMAKDIGKKCTIN